MKMQNETYINGQILFLDLRLSKFARYIRIYGAEGTRRRRRVYDSAVTVAKEGTEGTEGTEEATVATEEEVTAEEVMAAMEGTEVEVTGEEERDPDPGRGADRARGPPRVAGSRPSLRL